MKNKLRRLKVNNETYLWKREHYHLTKFDHSACTEKVTIYLEGFKKSPIQLLFREEDNLTLKTDIEKEKWCVGYPDDGVIWLFKYKPPLPNNEPYPVEQRQTININLNRPAVISALIKYFNSNGWSPKVSVKPFEINDALKYLELINLPKGIN